METKAQAVPMIIEGTRQEMWKQLEDTGLKMEAMPMITEVDNTARETVRMHMGCMQQEQKIRHNREITPLKISRDSPRVIDASMQPQQA